jgi:hypothetical protein
MKNVLIGAALGLAALVMYLPAAHADQTPTCQSADDMKNQVEMGSTKHGGKALRLDGPGAAIFLDYLNNRIGDPTDYRGETVIVGLYPDLGYVLVGFVVHGCADQQHVVKVDPGSFIRAYRAASGVPV